MQTRSKSLSAIVRAGLVSGFVGGVTFDLYLLFVGTVLTHSMTIVGLYQYVASAAVGKAAFADPNVAWLGLAMHLATSVGWGTGFAYVAWRTPQVRERPLLSGIAFGFVVFVAMQLVLVAASIWIPPHTDAFVNGLVSHIVFFGIPVAYIAVRRLRAT